MVHIYYCLAKALHLRLLISPAKKSCKLEYISDSTALDRKLVVGESTYICESASLVLCISSFTRTERDPEVFQFDLNITINRKLIFILKR